MLTGIIMAAGFSRRMGQNKLLLPFQGKPLFQYVIEAVMASQIDQTIVVTAFSEIMDFCERRNVDCRWNDMPENGQGRSIKIGVKHSDPQSDYMFFVADQPLLQTRTVDRIIRYYQENRGFIIVPKYKNTTANPKIFPNQFRETFLDLSEGVRGGCIIENNKRLVRYCDVDENQSFIDIDTPEAYANLLNDTIQFG